MIFFTFSKQGRLSGIFFYEKDPQKSVGPCLESALNNFLPFLKIYFHFLLPRLTWFPLCTPSETWSISSIWLHHDHSRPSSWNQVICFKLRDDCQYLPLFVGRSIFRLMQMLCLFKETTSKNISNQTFPVFRNRIK